MANANSPFGFKPYKHGSGGMPFRPTEYPLSSAYNQNLFQGDVVKLDGSGNVNIAAAGDQMIGVFWGVQWIYTDGSVYFRRYWPASQATQSNTLIRALVWDDPNTLFLAQCSGSLTAADIGTWLDIDTGTAGTTLTGISGQCVAADGGSNTQFRCEDVLSTRANYPVRNAAGNPDFATTGNYALAVVKPMKHARLGVASTKV